jgi:hypothetical protein
VENFRQSPALQPRNIVQRGEEGICAIVEFVGEVVRYHVKDSLQARQQPFIQGGGCAQSRLEDEPE